tara:strand:- start:597 stop:860 length:264 start_codon:yes stop_codon:yes gene_type:complete
MTHIKIYYPGDIRRIIVLASNYKRQLELQADYGNTDEGIEEENYLFLQLEKRFGFDLENNEWDREYCLRATNMERATYILEVIIPKF